MGRRKGELTAAAIGSRLATPSRCPGDRLQGFAWSVHGRLLLDLSVCERHHSVFHEDRWWIVYCFADAEHAEKFRMRFGGERFNPKDRGRGSNWAQWYKDGR